MEIWNFPGALFCKFCQKIPARFAQRNLAGPERELEWRSSAEGRMTSSAISEYRPSRNPAAKVFFTRRSSPEWKVKIATRPPGFRQAGRFRRKVSSAEN